MNQTIYPTEMLEIGTKVQVINKGRATIVNAEKTIDQHNLPIVVHTVQYTSGKQSKVNYSFIVRP